MNPNIPHTPFSTRLSGSAKETELRLRNIFQWQKKRPPLPLFLLTIVILMSCFGLVSCRIEEPPTDTSPADDINAEKEPPSSADTDFPVTPLEGDALSPDGTSEHYTVKTLFTDRDFDHDGTPETVELATVASESVVDYHNLQIKRADNTVLWDATAYTSHVGWISLFACTLDGEDYILQYCPTMYQGYCDYSYRVFSLDAEGNEIVHCENGISFDLNWGSGDNPLHTFDANSIADFTDEVNSLLAQSKLLVTTDHALTNIDPEYPQDELWWLKDDHPGYTYDETKTMRENLLALEQATNDL